MLWRTKGNSCLGRVGKALRVVGAVYSKTWTLGSVWVLENLLVCSIRIWDAHLGRKGLRIVLNSRDNPESEYVGFSDWLALTVPWELQQIQHICSLVKALVSVPDSVFFLFSMNCMWKGQNSELVINYTWINFLSNQKNKELGKMTG